MAGFGFFQNQEFSRDQYNVDLSWFVGNFAGSHEFKGGYEYEDIGVKNDNWNGGAGQRIYRYNCVQSATRDCQGNAYYFNHRIYLNSAGLDATELTTADIQAPLTVDTKATNDAWFVQDTWQVTSNLSLALGVRFSTQQLYNADGEVSADINDNVAPRLGFVWDPSSTGKMKVFGHWGKFYETIPMDIVIRSFGGEISVFSYNLSDDPNDVANDPTVRASRILGGGFSDVDPGTKGQNLEEYVVGFEYEFASDWAAGIKYINRQLNRVIEDALSADGNYYIGNPAYGQMTGTYDLGYAYGYNPCPTPEECPNFHPIPVPTREFSGIELTLKKRFSNNFQFITSFLFSEMTGNYDGTFQASTGQLDPNLNSAFDYADFQVNNTGEPVERHSVPVQVRRYLPLQLRALDRSFPLLHRRQTDHGYGLLQRLQQLGVLPVGTRRLRQCGCVLRGGRPPRLPDQARLEPGAQRPGRHLQPVQHAGRDEPQPALHHHRYRVQGVRLGHRRSVTADPTG